MATHTEQGVKTYTCTECSATKTESIPVITIHTYGAWEKYNETQHKRICACGEFELLNHDWDSGKITTPATNTTEGVKTYTCSTCNATKTEKIPVLVTNHEWDNGVITYAPLCTGEGIKTYTCVKCGETKEVTIIFTGHTYGAWESCSNTQHKRICACGEKEEIADHAWNNSLVTKEPTYTEYGIITYYCNTCGTSKTENIPMLEVPENAPHIIVDSKDALIGSTVTVIIQLKDNTGITSMRINVAYDSSLLTLTNVEYNNAMGGQSVLPENIETLNGNVVLYWTDGFADYEGNDTFVTLTFVVSDAAVVNETTTIAVTYDAEDIYDVEESNVAFICEDGIITFIEYTPGDISGDGVLNSKDTTRLMRYLAGWDVEVNEAALDVNGDGVVNTKDTTRLMRYLAGWDVEIY